MNQVIISRVFSLIVMLSLLLGAVGTPIQVAHAAGTVNLTAGVTYTQKFNKLANTGISSTLPTGWYFSESGADTNYTASNGSNNVGDTYSFGSDGSKDRAFGEITTNSFSTAIGANFFNDTGLAIDSLAITYTGEQWYSGKTVADQIDFQYSTNATSVSDGVATWTDVDSLDFISPNTTGPDNTALDGNANANRTVVSYTMTGLGIANGSSFWIRWNAFNALKTDDGLAVDDFSLTVIDVSELLSDSTVADFAGGTVGDCVVDDTIGNGALRLNIPSSTSCVFTSRIFDVDESVDWSALTSGGTTPVGTTVSFETRTGKRFVQDDTWSDWQAVNSPISSPDGQYLQYRATLSTTDSGQTPIVAKVKLNYNTKLPAVLGTPSGALTSWNNTFNWTGVTGATYYLLELYDGTDAQVVRKWYTAAASGCDTDLTCTLSPAELNVLANGSYKWRIEDQGTYGYGLKTAYTNFTLNAPVVTLSTPNSTLTSWDNTFSWNGIGVATLYLLEVYDANTNAQIHRKWYSNVTAGCDTDTSCVISPAELAGLANGSYKWRIRDYGAYGYGFYTDYLNFALNP